MSAVPAPELALAAADRRLRDQVAEHVFAQADGLAAALDGTEAYLGPVLERMLFPRGAPRAVRVADLGPALARWIAAALGALAEPAARIEGQLALGGDDGIDALVFPHGAPPRLDVAGLLRATRAAASRENAGLRAAIDGDEEAVLGTMRRVVRLWRVASTWHAFAARHVDPRAARLLDGVAAQWSAIDRAIAKTFADANPASASRSATQSFRQEGDPAI